MTSVETRQSPDRIVACAIEAHDRERLLVSGLSPEELRDASGLPGWTRAHVVSARRAFARAALRQFEKVLRYPGGEGTEGTEFFDGGREGRDREIEDGAALPPGTLVADLVSATAGLERVLARVGPSDWSRRASYRGTGTLLDVLVGEWRETELHMVDLRAGVTPSSWSPDFCAQLFAFLEPRVPAALTLQMRPDAGETFRLGRGPQAVRLTGAVGDLAAWLAGRPPAGPVRSSTGALPPLQRLRDGAR